MLLVFFLSKDVLLIFLTGAVDLSHSKIDVTPPCTGGQISSGIWAITRYIF
jgi:hypothetical protein